MRTRIGWFIALVAVLVPTALSAQSAMITGNVRNQMLVPVRGANVLIEELNLATVTNDAGVYRLVVPEAQVQGQQVTLSVRLIGFRAHEETITLSPGVTRVDVTLHEEAIALERVVVTGTAGQQAVRAQAAVVAQMDVAAVRDVSGATNVQQLLQSRLPGVSVQVQGGTSGASQTIRLRGTASLYLSNEPIIIIDGVVADRRSDEFHFTGGQRTSRLNDIRAEDIETIEVVKGPAASALYGADASGGVIHIITRKGRVGAGFSQSVSLEYNRLDIDHFEPPDNWGRCSATHVADPNRTLCYQQPVGTQVSDNPLKRYGVIQRGDRQSVTWTGRGGGQGYGYFLSVGFDDETGVFPNNTDENLSGRVRFDWQPSDKLTFDAGVAVIRNRTDLPQNDNNIYGYLGGSHLGDPYNVGTARDGWYFSPPPAIAQIENVTSAQRAQPRLTVGYTPFTWLRNRLTFGGDLVRTEARSFFPRNEEFWYQAATLNSGSIAQARSNYDRLTMDYLADISTFLTPRLSSDLSVGFQAVNTRSDLTRASGNAIPNNLAKAVASAAQNRTGTQTFSESRDVGVFGQWQLGLDDRLYFQVAMRADRRSAFAAVPKTFYSPKVGVSYVISDEAFWQDRFGHLVPSLRLRAAYGTTGRSPTTGVVTTFTPTPYAISAAALGQGVNPRRLGTPELRPEKGQELEAGLEASILEDRLGLEVTYFNKISKDQVLQVPMAPSAGFDLNPIKNLGEMFNRGFELAATARLVSQPNFAWEVRGALTTLTNEITDLGDLDEFATGWTQWVKEGHPAFGYFSHVIRGFEYNEAGDAIRAIVSDTMEFMGNYMPGREGNISSSITFLRNFRVYALLDFKSDYMLYNNTAQFRDRSWFNSEHAIRGTDVLSSEEWRSRFGPFVTESGSGISHTVVNEAYVEKGDFTRLREVSLSYTLPTQIATRFGASNASLVLGGRNLKLWTDYTGPDPEVGLYLNFDRREDFLTLPPERRFFARLNVQF